MRVLLKALKSIRRYLLFHLPGILVLSALCMQMGAVQVTHIACLTTGKHTVYIGEADLCCAGVPKRENSLSNYCCAVDQFAVEALPATDRKDIHTEGVQRTAVPFLQAFGTSLVLSQDSDSRVWKHCEPPLPEGREILAQQCRYQI